MHPTEMISRRLKLGAQYVRIDIGGLGVLERGFRAWKELFCFLKKTLSERANDSIFPNKIEILGRVCCTVPGYF